MAVCKKCGQSAKWLETKNGKFMLVNPEAVKLEDCKDGTVLVASSGMLIKKGACFGFDFGFVPHWATCPFADEFRKNGGQRGK